MRERKCCSPGEDHGGTGCAPAAREGPWWSRYPPAAQGGPHARVGRSPKEAVPLWRAHAGADCCQDLWPRGVRGAQAGAGLLAGFVTLWRTHVEQPIPEELHPAGDSHWRSSWRALCCGRDPTVKQGKSVRRKEQQTQCVMN